MEKTFQNYDSWYLLLSLLLSISKIELLKHQKLKVHFDPFSMKDLTLLN